jgi:hypothetical protein
MESSYVVRWGQTGEFRCKKITEAMGQLMWVMLRGHRVVTVSVEE